MASRVEPTTEQLLKEIDLLRGALRFAADAIRRLHGGQKVDALTVIAMMNSAMLLPLKLPYMPVGPQLPAEPHHQRAGGGRLSGEIHDIRRLAGFPEYPHDSHRFSRLTLPSRDGFCPYSARRVTARSIRIAQMAGTEQASIVTAARNRPVLFLRGMRPQSHPGRPDRAPEKRSPAPALDISTRVIVVFAALQALDVLTTILGWRLGAQEANPFIARLMDVGPVPGLLLAKLLGFVLFLAVFVARRTRLARLLNLWFAGLITWNLVIIFTLGWMRHNG